MFRYALGCAFNTRDLFTNFPYKKLKLTGRKCFAITGDDHRYRLIRKVFKYFMQIMIADVVQNNVTFWLPLFGTRKCNIHMRKVQGEEFKRLRRAGKWKDVDITKSFFCGYTMSFYMLGKRTPRVKDVYLSKQYRDAIVAKTNQGFPYGDSKNDKTIKDYYEQVYAAFPDIEQSDINRILTFTLRSLYLHNSYGGDTCISYRNFWCYIGHLKKDPQQHFFYYLRKLAVKLRVLYKRKRIKWDGYYYFALSEEQYQNYLAQRKKRGRPRKYFTFGTVYLYQIFDECKINEYYKEYIFRIPVITILTMKRFVRNLVSDKAELIVTRKPLRFKDILIYDNEYEFL